MNGNNYAPPESNVDCLNSESKWTCLRNTKRFTPHWTVGSPWPRHSDELPSL